LFNVLQKEFDWGIKFESRIMILSPGRLAFHGKRWIDSYHNQKEETQPYIDWVAAERIPKWLKFFEEVLKKNNGGQGLVQFQDMRSEDIIELCLIYIFFSYLCSDSI
jgi:hypothetical protein